MQKSYYKPYRAPDMGKILHPLLVMWDEHGLIESFEISITTDKEYADVVTAQGVRAADLKTRLPHGLFTDEPPSGIDIRIVERRDNSIGIQIA